MKVLNLMICLMLILPVVGNNLSAQEGEFANLKRYKSSNENLPEPSKTEIRVVFMGNSITDSWRLVFLKIINHILTGESAVRRLPRCLSDFVRM